MQRTAAPHPLERRAHEPADRGHARPGARAARRRHSAQARAGRPRRADRSAWCRSIRPRIPERTHRACVSEGDLTGDWDADRLAQVASNLIGNALQHGDGGERGAGPARRHAARRVVALGRRTPAPSPPTCCRTSSIRSAAASGEPGRNEGLGPGPLHRAADRPRAPGQRRRAVRGHAYIRYSGSDHPAPARTRSAEALRFSVLCLSRRVSST